MARFDLGLSEAEFWAVTPRQLSALQDRFASAHRRADARAALVACTIANVHRGKGKRAYRVEDFMPGPRRRQTWREQLALARQLTMALGGTIGPDVP